MATFRLNAHQRQLLASCIEIGGEGAADNHTEVGGDNSQEDLELIARLIEELQESEATETIITIAPTRLDDADDFEGTDTSGLPQEDQEAYGLYEQTGDERLRTVM